MIQKILLNMIMSVTVFANTAQACYNSGSSSGLESYTTLIDFNDGSALGLTNGDMVSDQWKDLGVVFGDGTVKWSEYTLLNISGLYGSIDTGSISSICFSKDVSAAAFQFFALPTWSDSITIQAKNNGDVVKTITIPKTGNWLKSGRWYSFTGLVFDEIGFNTGALYWNLDNLEFTVVPTTVDPITADPTPVEPIQAVPVPSAVLLAGSGLLGLFGLKRGTAIGG